MNKDLENFGIVEYESLDYGTYNLVGPEGLYTENFKYDSADFDRLYMKKVRLPDGKGNIVYLLSDTFEKSVIMTNGDDFIYPPVYRKFFCPLVSMGSFMNKRYVVNNNKVKNDRITFIRDNCKLQPIMMRNLIATNQGVFYSTADLYNAMKPIADRYPVKRLYTELLSTFISAADQCLPKGIESDGKNNRRLLIIDAEAFRFKAGTPLKENKLNPLFLIYLAFFKTKGLKVTGLDIDILICQKNLFLKFNPSTIEFASFNKFKRGLFRIMNANLDEYVDALPDEDKDELMDTPTALSISDVVDQTTRPYTNNISLDIKTTLNTAVQAKIQQTAAQKYEVNKQAVLSVDGNMPIVDDKKSVMSTNPIDGQFSPSKSKMFQSIIDDTPLTVETDKSINELEVDSDEFVAAVKDDTVELLSSDEGLLEEIDDEIQQKIAPLSNLGTAPVNSARDLKLREEQRQLRIKQSTIEEVLARDTRNIPIQTEDKSHIMTSGNPNMKSITFNNFDRTYIDELYMKDILACFDSMKDKDSPFYITAIEVEDNSTPEDYQETWTIKIVDAYGKRSTLKVDIPKFYNDKFMILGGNKYIILKQNFYNPLVKDTLDTVIMTTNYNKVTINRRATKSLGYVEKIFALLRRDKDKSVFTPGDSVKTNMRYLSSLEFDELGRRLFKFKTETCELYFSRQHLLEYFKDDFPEDMKPNEFFVGFENGLPVTVDENSGRDKFGRTLIEIMEDNMDDETKAAFNKTKTINLPMIVEAKMAGQKLPIGAILVIWMGITKMMNLLKIDWKFYEGKSRITEERGKSYIRFNDGILEYESLMFSDMIVKGINKMNPERYTFEQFNSDEGYQDYVYSIWGEYEAGQSMGSYNGILEIKMFHTFLVDPITKEVCNDLGLPDTAEELIVYAVKMLCDNSYVSKADDRSYRIRSVEMVPAILYSCLAEQYKEYLKKGSKTPFTLNQRIVISKLQAEKTVDEYSTLNPTTEVAKTHVVSTKGYKGSNSEHSYDEEKRSYDATSIGKIAMSTSNDANVGINKELVIEPTIANARGYRQQIDDLSTLKDVNVFSPVEMLTPGTVRNEDPIRTAIAGKQSQHVIPVEDSSLSLVSNGFDEALQFHLSDDFVVNAEEDGQVTEINEKLGFVVVTYKSGKVKAIYTKPDVVKNSGGGFFIANRLKAVYTKPGTKFKKDEVLAYHDKYFRFSKLNGLRYVIGPMVKMAMMSSYNTYEDAGIATESLAERMTTKIVYQEQFPFFKNSNVEWIAKIGDHVNFGDPLVKFGSVHDDDELSTYLAKLSNRGNTSLGFETNNEKRAHHAGTIIDVKMYTLLEPEELSPSLCKIMKDFFQIGVDKGEFLTKYDATAGLVKAGYLLRDSVKPVKSRYNSIKGFKGIDVLIEYYIEHDDIIGIGDKIAIYSANKQIISEIVPKGLEPYSEFRPEEEVSVITSPGTIARRMTPAIISISSAMKCMIELKRKLADVIEFEK